MRDLNIRNEEEVEEAHELANSIHKVLYARYDQGGRCPADKVDIITLGFVIAFAHYLTYTAEPETHEDIIESFGDMVRAAVEQNRHIRPEFVHDH